MFTSDSLLFTFLHFPATFVTTAVECEERDAHEDEKGQETVDDVDADPGRVGQVSRPGQMRRVHTAKITLTTPLSRVRANTGGVLVSFKTILMFL